MRNYVYSSVFFILLLALVGCDSPDESLEPSDKFVEIANQPEMPTEGLESDEKAPVDSESAEVLTEEEADPSPDESTHVDSSKIHAIGNLQGDSASRHFGRDQPLCGVHGGPCTLWDVPEHVHGALQRLGGQDRRALARTLVRILAGELLPGGVEGELEHVRQLGDALVDWEPGRAETERRSTDTLDA